MEIMLDKDVNSRLFDFIEKFKMSNVLNLIIKEYESAEKSLSVHYIGEYNKNDVMF